MRGEGEGQTKGHLYVFVSVAWRDCAKEMAGFPT